MKQKLRSYIAYVDAIIILFLLFLTIVGVAYLGNVSLINDRPLTFYEKIARKLARLINIDSTSSIKDRLDNILFSVNVFTILYACYFYNYKITSAGRIISLIPLFVWIIAYGAPWIFDEPALTEEWHDYKEYIVAVLITLVFMIVDNVIAKCEPSIKDKIIPAFTAKYIGFPTLITLIFIGLLHTVFIFVPDKNAISHNSVFHKEAAVAFISAASVACMVLGNVILALVTLPSYAQSLKFSYQTARKEKEIHMQKYFIVPMGATLVAFLAFFAAITVTFVPGVAAIYPAAALEVALGVWFGIWGGLASLLGLAIAGSLGGWFPFQNGIILSFSDLILAIIPGIAVRSFGLNPSLPSMRHIFGLVVAAMIGSFLGSLWYNLINWKIFGVLAGWNSFVAGIVGWNLGNFFVILFICIPILKFGTPIIKSLDLYQKRLI